MGEQKEETRSSSLIKFLDDNVRYIKYPFFGVGIVGAVIIARSIRLGTKFFSVKHIPEEFFQKHFTLHGQVKEVIKIGDHEQPLVLSINHTPIFRTPQTLRPFLFLKPEKSPVGQAKFLRVTIPGFELKSQFFYDLQSKLAGEKVAFTLIAKDDKADNAYALVYLKVFKFKIIPTYQNVSFWCAENGFGAATAVRYPSDFTSSRTFNAYYSKLLKIEEKAVRKHRGMWKEHPSQRQQRWITRVLKYLRFWRNKCLSSLLRQSSHNQKSQKLHKV